MENTAFGNCLHLLHRQRAALTHAIDVLESVAPAAAKPEPQIHIVPRRRKHWHMNAEAKEKIRQATIMRWKKARRNGQTSLAA